MNTETNMTANPLTQFTQPSILEAIGPARLTRFFNEFAPDLHAANLVAPAPASESGDANYFHSVAVLFSFPALLPERMQAALAAIERAAAPENSERLEAVFFQQFPHINMSAP